ncbi:MAG: putative methyltransferase [Actinomycetia bacterium]|nr:putative methyltransferase [Actinomycetes bacterium]
MPNEWQQPFTGLARDWRNLLFPTAADDTFADYYAQTLTFALLLARTEDIDVAGADMNQIARKLGAGQAHALMSKALQLLTDSATDQLAVTLDLLRRVVGVLGADRVRAGCNTHAGYRVDVEKHLIPGIGAHRLDKLEPEHFEKLYAKMQHAGLKAGTAHHVHRTVRAALNEAVRRKHLSRLSGCRSAGRSSWASASSRPSRLLRSQPFPWQSRLAS